MLLKLLFFNGNLRGNIALSFINTAQQLTFTVFLKYSEASCTQQVKKKKENMYKIEH